VTLDPAVMTALQGATRTAVYGATTLVVGAALFDAVVISRAIGLTPLEIASARARARKIGFVAAIVLVAAYLTRLYLQVIDSFLVAVPSADMIRQLFFLTRDWGHGMLAQIIISALVFCLLLYARRARSSALGVIAVTAPMAAASVPLTGHAVAHAGSIAVAAQATHVFAAGGWLGTLSVLWLIGRRVQSTASLASIVRAFSPVALTCAGLLGFAGAATYFLHVGGLDQLLTTPYGLVLVTKIAVFLSASGVGYVNWKHLTPRLMEGGQRARFTQAAALEISLAVVAILLTAVLTNLPQPGE
jgi:putative copper resistance protein D